MNYGFVSVVFIILGMLVGLLVYFYPVSVMRIQVKFYEKINWRIEPISLQKEFDRTRNTGLYLVVLSVLSGIYIKFFI